MRILMAVGLVLGVCGSAGAQEVWDRCGQQPTLDLKMACVQGQAQVESSRQQAVGMALFGSGPALIQGMNQGMQHMQLKPMPPMSVAPPVRYTPMPGTNPGWSR